MGFIHFLQLILIVAILLGVGIPLFGKLKLKKLVEPVDPAIDKFKHLLVRKEETLISIKELEFDYNTGKSQNPIIKSFFTNWKRKRREFWNNWISWSRKAKKANLVNPIKPDTTVGPY